MAAEEEILNEPEVSDDGSGTPTGDPDPLGLRKRAASSDPLGLRARSAPKAFQVEISEPKFKSTPAPIGEKTFSDLPPIDEYGLTKLQNKAHEAKSKLDEELLGNDA